MESPGFRTTSPTIKNTKLQSFLFVNFRLFFTFIIAPFTSLFFNSHFFTILPHTQSCIKKLIEKKICTCIICMQLHQPFTTRGCTKVKTPHVYKVTHSWRKVNCLICDSPNDDIKNYNKNKNNGGCIDKETCIVNYA